MNWLKLQTVIADLVDTMGVNVKDGNDRLNNIAGLATEQAGSLFMETAYCDKELDGNYHVDIPCDIENLHLVLYNGHIVSKSGEFNNLLQCPFPSGSFHYSIVDDKLKLPVTTGTVTFIYHRVPIDEDGNVMVHGNAHFRDYINFFTIARLILAGLDHKAIKSYEAAVNLAERALARARNQVKMGSWLNTYEQILRNLSRPIEPKNMFSRGFNDN